METNDAPLNCLLLLTTNMPTDIRARRRENLMKTQVRATIVPVLQDLKRELAESTLQLRGELLGTHVTTLYMYTAWLFALVVAAVVAVRIRKPL